MLLIDEIIPPHIIFCHFYCIILLHCFVLVERVWFRVHVEVTVYVSRHQSQQGPQ